MFAYRLAYDGTQFHGFQRQPSVSTVEGVLFEGLQTLGLVETTTDKPAGYSAASRTDAGVSAVAQTITLDGPEWLSPAAMNSTLPESVRAWARRPVPASFHAGHNAVARSYEYHLSAPEASLDRAKSAADRVEGQHDFHNFTPAGGETVRKIREITVSRDGDYFVITVTGDGFVRHQVRRMVSLIANIAHEEATLSSIADLLGDQPLTGPNGLSTAPAEPLVLTAVEYETVSFEADEVAETVRSVFTEKGIRNRTRARVAESVATGITEPMGDGK